MILITGTVKLREGARDAMRAAAADMLEATRAEPGCQTYRYAFDLDDDHTMTFHEEWETEEAVAAHFASDHMREFGRRLPELVAGAPEITKWVGAEPADLG